MSAAFAAAQATSAEPEVVRTTIDEILATREFGKKETPFGRLVQRVLDWLSDLLPDGWIDPAGLGVLAQAIVWIVLAALVALVVWGIVRSVRDRARPAELAAAAAADPEIVRARRVADLRRRAREANARGEHVLALRLEFTALVVGLGERGDLEYRDAFTNRELLERGQPRRESEALLRPLVPELDRKSFGGEPASSADFERLSALCDTLLSGARA